MNKVEQIHNDLFDLLMQQHEHDPEFRFTFRRSNRNSRLDKGYWFYGNEFYATVSFWSGMDWKNKTPNILFTMLVEDGESFLETNVSDSDEKRRFVTQFLVSQLALKEEGVRYRKYYPEWGSDYMASLKSFLKNEKPLIDAAIRANPHYFSQSGDNAIGFIPKEDFDEQQERISLYRSKMVDQGARISKNTPRRPQRIASVRLENFGPIQYIALEEIPYATQWVFLTGENGTGKTSVLRALATALCNRKTTPEESPPDMPFRASLALYDEDRALFQLDRTSNQDIGQEGMLITGFATYGASRLRTGHIESSVEPTGEMGENPLYASLFDHDAILADLQAHLDAWRAKAIPEEVFEKRKFYLTEILTDIFANLYRIDFDVEKDGRAITYYVERDSEGGPFKRVTFEQLASGLKSLIAMIGDILIRIYSQQPDIDDPAQFTGMVLIDEIDLHLHPKLQKELVEQLTQTFPGIQFIATTHSPIPLLGAPRASRIFKVERSSALGVTVQRLDDKLILGDLLPNTILTSPIFGLDDIIPNSHDANNMVRTETNYADITFNDIVRKKINEFLTDEREQKLINLFKSRTK